jgi:hypothetical protein
MSITALFDQLWNQYTEQNPQALSVYQLLTTQGELVLNDHIAFRTFNLAKISIDVLAKPFLDLGYVEAGQYTFEEKKLKAIHYIHPKQTHLPRVFISMLLVEQFSPFLQSTVKEWVQRIPSELFGSQSLLSSGNSGFQPSFQTYTQLLQESEYAAWLYINGFRANHFTVSINAITQFHDIHQLNHFLKQNGFKLNASGGEVKGSPEQLLEQSSTLADSLQMQFDDGLHTVTGCYYEFAKRYTDASGQLYDGFIARSADKIFESTHAR